jgi:hypothetical protein
VHASANLELLCIARPPTPIQARPKNKKKLKKKHHQKNQGNMEKYGETVSIWVHPRVMYGWVRAWLLLRRMVPFC